MTPTEIIAQAMASGYKGSFTQLIQEQTAPPSVPQTPTPTAIPTASAPAPQLPQQPQPTLVRSYMPTEPGISKLRTDTSATVLTEPSLYASGGYAGKTQDWLKRSNQVKR